MPQNDFLPFSASNVANVISQAVYSAAAYLANGRSSGILPSNVYNKVARQGSIAAYLLGQLIADYGLDAFDNSDTATLLANLKQALGAPTTGALRITYSNVADPGWLMFDDTSIGSTGSAAVHKGADFQNLFVKLYGTISNTWAPVSGGRSGNAANDFTSNRTMTLPSMLGRALIIAGTGNSLTARALGQSLGEELHTMTLSELVSHTHGYGIVTATLNGGGVGSNQSSALAGTNTTGSQGSTTPFNVMQPSSAINLMVRK